jgi:dephospho-CoA kinase
MSLDDDISGQIQELVHLKCEQESEVNRLEERKSCRGGETTWNWNEKQEYDLEEKRALLDFLRAMAANLNNAGRKWMAEFNELLSERFHWSETW